MIVPTYNRCGLLRKTLPTILNQDLPPDEYEVIVVSDGSNDATIEYVSTLATSVSVRILDRPHGGLAGARNAGIEAARGDLVLLIDDDMLCSPTWAREHLTAHLSAGSCVVCGPTLTATESRPGLATEMSREWYENYAMRLTREGGPRSQCDAWVTSNCSAARALLLSHGGFDETFRYQEDRELSFRLWSAGVSFRYLPDATAHEIYSKSASNVVRSDAVQRGVSEVQLCRKFPFYRPHSLPARMIGRSPAKLLLVWLACAFPISPEPVLNAMCHVAERLRRIPVMRRIGFRLLRYRMAIAAMRSAIHEVGSWAEIRREFGAALPVLLYHHIGPLRPGTLPELTISPANFERQVARLAKHGFVGIRPSDWLAWIREGRSLPDRPILITLDDAYADIADFALPVLRRYGFGAAVYVVTSRIGQTIRWDGMTDSAAYSLMNADQIRHWASQGIEFGGHSRTHPHLTELHGDRLTDEIEGCAEDIAGLLGARAASFAYPHGSVNQEVRERVSGSFALGLSCAPGLNRLATDPSMVRRAEITPSDGILDFIIGAYLGRLPVQYLRVHLPYRLKAVWHRWRKRAHSLLFFSGLVYVTEFRHFAV